MEKKFAHAQAQLASRAAIMLQIGAAEKLYMAAYPGIGALTFRLGEYSLGGEQSGHIIFNDYATTGDGQLTAIQLLSILKRKKISLEQAASVMTRFPQHMINVEVSNDGKIAFYTDHVIKEALMAANEEFADKGRIVVRPSGTEPLVRVMTEGEDPQQTKDICEKVANIIKQQLSVK